MELSVHDIVLIRCGLLRRMDSLKGRQDCAASYARSKELMDMLFPLVRDGKGAVLTPLAIDNWNNNAIQYPRLLAELRAFGLTKRQYAFLRESMDLSVGEIGEIFERAEIDWQLILAKS